MRTIVEDIVMREFECYLVYGDLEARKMLVSIRKELDLDWSTSSFVKR